MSLNNANDILMSSMVEMSRILNSRCNLELSADIQYPARYNIPIDGEFYESLAELGYGRIKQYNRIYLSAIKHYNTYVLVICDDESLLININKHIHKNPTVIYYIRHPKIPQYIIDILDNKSLQTDLIYIMRFDYAGFGGCYKYEAARRISNDNINNYMYLISHYAKYKHELRMGTGNIPKATQNFNLLEYERCRPNKN